MNRLHLSSLSLIVYQRYHVVLAGQLRVCLYGNRKFDFLHPPSCYSIFYFSVSLCDSQTRIITGRHRKGHGNSITKARTEEKGENGFLFSGAEEEVTTRKNEKGKKKRNISQEKQANVPPSQKKKKGETWEYRKRIIPLLSLARYRIDFDALIRRLILVRIFDFLCIDRWWWGHFFSLSMEGYLEIPTSCFF